MNRQGRTAAEATKRRLSEPFRYSRILSICSALLLIRQGSFYVMADSCGSHLTRLPFWKSNGRAGKIKFEMAASRPCSD